MILSTIAVWFFTLGLSNARSAPLGHRLDRSILRQQSQSSCTPSAGGSESTDDTPAIAAAIASCGDGGTIVIPEGTTYYLNSYLSFAGCADCIFQLEGLLQFTSNTTYWNGRTAMIEVSGISGLTIESTTGAGIMDGNGQDSWDLFAEDSSYARPTLLYITGSSDITVKGFQQKNPPNVFNSVSGGSTNIIFSNLEMDATSNSDNPAANTDGFDVGESTYVTIKDVKVTNDDDCVAFKPSSNYVTVETVECIGSHGISVGSLGEDGDNWVKNIYVSNATMINSTKAAGIKTYPSGGSHGTSTVTNVTFTGFTVDNCDYAVQIQSCYGETTDYCEEYPGNATLTDVYFEGFSGTTSTAYEPVTANLDCGADGTCDVQLVDYTVVSSDGESEVLCANTSSDLGVTCTSGASG
ncbi:hypothetical protein ASPZODRAFT_63155 [Penicilliopsis zonata CBS 506.65]|uniref:Endo-polygalacturonase n=1 Tax=Penicilliopsis zonata CBS 506.65 TaxID=1073090 RepID=A0A1L9SKM9_9EURO|nr:hypothetical protein ASPZODRAFT_63155 [Penicilliopsis zonata CBS 506.65]OJJ47727.1 hypothetical protein ASPZODRAFT_63155 [Penicilliopsis zonata CBS 506.65]